MTQRIADVLVALLFKACRVRCGVLDDWSANTPQTPRPAPHPRVRAGASNPKDAA